jgi:D-serine deaminase-like pyridoxal phosphate-dependent protein
VAGGARVTVAVDSPETLDAAVRGGVREVLVDVNVGLPRCGIAPTAPARWPTAPAPPGWRSAA